MPGRSMLACSWIPMPFRMIRSEPSLNAPEHVTSCRTHTHTHTNSWTHTESASGPQRCAHVSHLTLSLSLQVHHTHVHYGPQVSEGLHYSHKRALVITVHIQLQTHAALTNTPSLQHHHQPVRLPTLTSWESPSLDPTNTTPLSRYVRHSAMEV